MADERKKILLVEDSDDEAFLLSLVIQKQHSAELIARVCDGEQAVAYLGATGVYADRNEYPLPDIVLLDLNMPRMNGFEVLEWLRAQSEKPEVIVFTSSQREADRDRCLELGADEFVIKPLDVKALKEFVQWLVTRDSEKPGDMAKLTRGI